MWMESIPKSRNGALYYPWLHAADPMQAGAPRLTAPSGTIAGIYASTDTNRGVWKAPAGTAAKLIGVTGLAHRVGAAESQALNARGVNCLRVFPASGAVAWGARTLQGENALASEWKYVPVRRLALFLEESLARGTQWAVFEPNDEPLWTRIVSRMRAPFFTTCGGTVR